jgi:hypothetical protein
MTVIVSKPAVNLREELASLRNQGGYQEYTAAEILTAITTVDGSGSGLDADLLDGQEGSYYLNTATTFGGDVSGTYNAIVVADDSHNHIISNVDGLQTALDSKLNLSGGTMTGTLVITGELSATSLVTSQVLAATAAGGAGAVGTYAFARRPGSTGSQAPFNFGSTYAGSELRPAGLSASNATGETNPYWYDTATIYIGKNSDGALSGTWRAMCQTDTTTVGDENPVGVFLRIS